MLHTVTGAFCDTRAGDLSLRFDLAPRQALCTLAVEDAGGCLELRLLGHSHQVLATVGTEVVSEVVACESGRSRLPVSARRALARGVYIFESQVEALSPPALSRQAERLLAGFSEHPGALVGVFPGLPNALTVVVAETCHRELAWRSWHLYPQTVEAVRTRSRVRTHGAGERPWLGPGRAAGPEGGDIEDRGWDKS